MPVSPGKPPSAGATPPTFKLRPRASHHRPPAADEVGSSTITAASPLKPLQQHGGIYTISPDGPFMYPSAGGDPSVAPRAPPPPAFAQFFGAEACRSPIKKQKTQDCIRLHTETSPIYEKSPNNDAAPWSPQISTSAVALKSPSLHKFPRSPYDDQELSPSSISAPSSGNGKRSLEPDEGSTSALSSDGQASSPLTPRGREMMQNLCLNSPSPTLSSMSRTPENTSSSRSYPQVINQRLPSMPTFSFSPSLNLSEKECISPKMESGSRSRSNTLDSSVRETIVFSTGSIPTPQGTPKRCPRSSFGSSTGSPFNSLRGGLHSLAGQRTPGSVFKALPPRLYPNGREDNSASSITSVTSASCGSSFSNSPSPRVVPLTVLSKDGSTRKSPKTSNSPKPPQFDSPLMRSLDLAEGDSTSDLLRAPELNDVKMPQASPLSTESSSELLPRIKLTPRGKNNLFAPPPKLDPSPGGDACGLRMPSLSLFGPKEQTEDKEAAEMDSLLNGFEQHHKAAFGREDPNQKSTEGAFGRVESEEAEIAALTCQGQMPSLWLPPTGLSQEKGDACSDGDASHLSPGDQKPMPSITFNLQSRQEDPPSSPRFLPRLTPTAENKSRSLFDSSNAQDSFTRILRAEAIADAARSNEPLTDEDGTIDDFLLCLPQPNQEKECPSKSSQICSDLGFPVLKSSHAESPLYSKPRNASNGSIIKRSNWSGHSLRGLSSPATPTIFEEGHNDDSRSRPTNEDLGFDSFNKREVSDATFTTFCSLSECDSSEIVASPKCHRAKALGSTSLVSTSSLCGLDIVHETSVGVEGFDQVPVLLPSESSEFSATMFKPMVRSEYSMNSLGLSVDSDNTQRDLFTPPVAMSAPNNRTMLSPPPLRRPSASFDVALCDVTGI